MDEIDNVCVVTQPVSNASESHVRDMLNIVNAITSVSLLTVNLPEDASLRNDYEVINIATTGTGTSIPVAAIRFLRNQLRMAYVLRQREESIALFFGSTSYLIPILAAKLSGKTVVLEPRGDVPLTLRLHWGQRVPTPIARMLAGSVWCLEEVGYRLSDAIITYTPSMAEELGLDRFESKLYPNGARYVDTETLYPRILFENRENVVGFLGRLDEEKNVRLLAAAAKKLPADVNFRFIGDGDLREELEYELSEEISEGRVEFRGWVDHNKISGELNELRLLVLLSEPTEGLPTVILESMACGTPVLATPVSGVPDVVQDGKTGFLIHKKCDQEIATSIENILMRQDMNEISQNAKIKIEENYSIEEAIARYDTILTSISN